MSAKGNLKFRGGANKAAVLAKLSAISFLAIPTLAGTQQKEIVLPLCLASNSHSKTSKTKG